VFQVQKEKNMYFGYDPSYSQNYNQNAYQNVVYDNSSNQQAKRVNQLNFDQYANNMPGR
jgi:hypothetical protein